MKDIFVGNIQRFSLHDGPGIRTTAFLMGCSIRCPWCANPENLRMQTIHYPDATSSYGHSYTADELVTALLKDRVYYADGGGVTFSGGEALLQAEQLVPVWEKLQQERINLAIETALFVPKHCVALAIPYINHWFIDLKIADRVSCQQILQGDIDQYLQNVQWLHTHAIPYTMRFPLVADVTTKEANLQAIIAILNQYPPRKLQIFPIHDLARSKYRNLHQSFHNYPSISNNTVIAIADRLSADAHIPCEILTIT